MPILSLKPNHRAVKAYHAALEQASHHGLSHEGAVAPAFAALLRHCAAQARYTLAEQFRMRPAGREIQVDGALLDVFSLVRGVWEAKDPQDDLETAIRYKFEAGYPRANTLFQAPERAVLYQHGRRALEADLSRDRELVEALEAFFAYEAPEIAQWEQAVETFKETVPQMAKGLLARIELERKSNPAFIRAYAGFADQCRQTVNPNLSNAAVEEMLIQHLLTERIIRRVFDNPDFIERNAIGREIEGVIRALTSTSFSRNDFTGSADRFYGAIERTAATLEDWGEKQAFLNSVYERFFQGYSVRQADTHGIVYTPQPIVAFMVRSVEALLGREFGRSLADAGVHILDPFVGTGNYLLHVMRSLPKTRLPDKYRRELHANEVLLMPYYVAAMNIEHEYYTATGQYEAFSGLCLVDTFSMAESAQMDLWSAENTKRVTEQKAAPITVILGNPPYNAHQVNENDNSRNRKYENKQGDGLDQLVSKTYAASSAASNLNALSDPYVKAFRWASDRIGDEGLVAYISNNSFLEGLAFDGLRACLEREFDAIYHLDLGGNVRKNPKLSGTTHNVFGIQVGVGITFLVRHKERRSDPGRVWYARMDEFWTKEQKYAYLDQAADLEALPWRELTPDARHTWLTGGLRAEWDDLLPLGSKEAKREARRGKDTEVVFRSYGRGIATSRDSWAYNYDRAALAENMGRMIGAYNDHVARWERFGTNKPDLDSFVNNDAAEIVWSRDLKADLKRKRVAEFAEAKIRRALYRPFTRQSLFFDPIMNEEIYQLPALFPTAASESENRAICVTDRGSEKAFMCLMTDAIPDLHLVGAGASAQVFPFYTYHETPGGLERRENITDWALARAQAHYGAGEITKWDLFYYAYALLHHPTYRQRYAADLKRDLPRLPLEPDFAAYAAAGRRLAEHHLGYEAAAPYPLRFIETPGASLDWRVEKMRLGREKDQIVVNPFLTLGGVPEQAFAYRLGHRSALEWVLDQYQVTVDARSGLRNDPNRPEDPEYIVRLVGQVIAVSLETVEIVAALPPLVG